jgi:hypothetical protein
VSWTFTLFGTWGRFYETGLTEVYEQNSESDNYKFVNLEFCRF